MTSPRREYRRCGSARTRLLDVAHLQGWDYRIRDPRVTFEKSGVVLEVEFTATGMIRYASRLIGTADADRTLDRIGKGTVRTSGLFDIVRDWMIPHEDPTTRARR